MEQKGVTECRQYLRGRVQPFGLRFYKTGTGRFCKTFDLWCGGVVIEQTHHFPIFRHCVAYDDLALLLKGIKEGDWLEFWGWTSNEGVTDENFQQKRNHEGKPIMREKVIGEQAVIMQTPPHQGRLESMGATSS